MKTDEEVVQEQFETWKASLPKCAGYGGGCDGDLVGLEHEDNCPMKGKQVATIADAFSAGALAMQRTERERLKPWLRHKWGCQISHGDDLVSKGCTCGLDEALGGTK